MEPFTDMEKNQINSFRERISDLLPKMTDFQKQDINLIRFIRARDTLDKAEEMIRKHYQWREEKDIDHILDIKTLDFEIEYPILVCGRDKDGFPVFVADLGRWDFRKAMESGQKKMFVIYVQKYFEQLLRVSENLTKGGKVITQVFAIMDFEEFSFRQVASKDVIQAILELISIFESQYPEILRAAYVINAPKVFQILWALVKPMLTERTLSKVHIFGCNKEQWKAPLRTKIDFENNFPSAYGGGVNTCIEYKFAYGSDIFKYGKYEVFPEEELITMTVDAGTKHKIDFDVKKGSKLLWNFCTFNCDISFCLQYENIKEIVKNCRVDSHLVKQRGEIVCPETGRYTFIFDNTYSAFTSKQLKYCIKVREH